ncbi:hypothetical protein ERO13_D03G131500v2 [Gossypium hirsutum]|uniref:Chitinase 2 n=2 Tax=Gossypium TaxID=3633 RepID=A0A1U8NNN3_GOSHI|nr:chitinase 2-like [Gossypium hirsutum]KAB2038560.1 hypothetical protein ES319_D03G154100v1 [Gossypium barbadense]KAG4155761.1 hypothetical protein ERO13_D03G131500v2 [Gossypium hirsutum]
MEFHRLLFTFFIFQALIISQISILCTANSKLFREYIGAEFKDVKFSDVPINPNVDFHFILSFAIDYDTSTSPSPTNGKFNVFWDSTNLSPSHVSSIKSKHPNVKVAISLGGYTVGSQFAYFKPSTVRSWVANAATSLTSIIKKYNLDGIDIDYEHFQADPQTFAESIGLLIKALKRNKVISFASIAPYADNEVQRQYLALWNKYGDIIDYVNFQFYAYDKGTTIPQFLSYFNNQSSNYNGGKVLVSFQSDVRRGLTPEDGFFDACNMLKSQQRLHGIFVWSADDSKADGFIYEKQSQEILD